jgi:hypothetical protein
MEKLFTLQGKLDNFHHNWAGIDAVHVVKGYWSWLVVSFISGQNNISPDSQGYSEPPVPEAWVNEYAQHVQSEFEVTYRFTRKVIPELEFEEQDKGIQVYILVAPGDGGIQYNGLDIFIENVPVPKVYVQNKKILGWIPLACFCFEREIRNNLLKHSIENG